MNVRGGIRDDEESGFDRPARRTRPRTKDRPDYSRADVGIVLTVDRGRYHCDVDGRSVVAAKARALGRGKVIVGDQVRLLGDTSGAEGTLARIVDVLPGRPNLIVTLPGTGDRPAVMLSGHFSAYQRA